MKAHDSASFSENPAPVNHRRKSRILVLALISGVMVIALMALWFEGMIRTFFMPTGAMTPAISPGDHILMERISLLNSPPRRGDIVVFKTDGIASLPPGQMYAMRVAGEPGDHVRIAGGDLFVNGSQVTLRNSAGEIVHEPPHFGAFQARTEMTVPSGSYFVLGDNSTNSFDSRFWGSVPGANITGRICFRYWPFKKLGVVE